MNQNNNLIEGFFEYKGIEGFNPTLSFTRRTYAVLFLGYSISLALTYPFKNIMDADITQGALFWILRILSFVVFYVPPVFVTKSHVILRRFIPRYTLFVLRIIFLPFFIVAYSSYLTTFLLISLGVSLHLILTIYACIPRNKYVHSYWIVPFWSLLALSALIGLNLSVPSFAENYPVFTILLSTLEAFIYGIYVVYETGFLLNEGFYQLNWNEYVFGAIVLQFDYLGIIIGVRNLILKCKRRQ